MLGYGTHKRIDNNPKPNQTREGEPVFVISENRELIEKVREHRLNNPYYYDEWKESRWLEAS